jgi:multidrug efflux pump subunit AcrB
MVTGAELVERFNGFVSPRCMGSAQAPGISSGDAIKAVEEVAATLPEGYRTEWVGQAFQEKRTGSASIIAFVFGIIMVFLILAAQYEKWSLPLAVIMAVPFAMLGCPGGGTDARHAQRHLLPDRAGGADRAGGQERHPDRRVCGPESRPKA